MMTSVSQTISQLQGLKKPNLSFGRGTGRLAQLHNFGDNPGRLEAFTYIPDRLEGGAPLVVVLHGCGQSAAGYDHGAGWSTLADRYGFALLFPQQTAANNANRCFNWFNPHDARRDAGEASSIRRMVDQVVRDQAIDPQRIFITGLSAGGAMTSVMLATYPELFAGGAIIAGLPYGSAGNIPEALARMRGEGLPDSAALASLVRNASDHEGAWPTISIWHGSRDQTVVPANAAAILQQWQQLHEVVSTPSRADIVDGFPHRVWTDDAGREVIEEYSITDMGHGTPLATESADGCGASAPFMLEVGISSTQRIAEFWGIAESWGIAEPADARVSTMVAARRPERPRPYHPGAAAETEAPATGAPVRVQAVMEKALRSAGLMR